MNITKILPYTVYPPDGDAYDYVCKLLAQEIDPPSSGVEKLVFAERTVYCSPLRRAKESVDI